MSNQFILWKCMSGNDPFKSKLNVFDGRVIARLSFSQYIVLSHFQKRNLLCHLSIIRQYGEDCQWTSFPIDLFLGYFWPPLVTTSSIRHRILYHRFRFDFLSSSHLFTQFFGCLHKSLSILGSSQSYRSNEWSLLHIVQSKNTIDSLLEFPSVRWISSFQCYYLFSSQCQWENNRFNDWSSTYLIELERKIRMNRSSLNSIPCH